MWGGGGSLLQYRHGVPGVMVTEVNPHRRPHCRPSTTPFDLAGPWSCLRGKHHPEIPGIFAPAFLVALLPRPPFFYAVMGLVWGHH